MRDIVRVAIGVVGSMLELVTTEVRVSLVAAHVQAAI